MMMMDDQTHAETRGILLACSDSREISAWSFGPLSRSPVS
jgi:hypothetical protein